MHCAPDNFNLTAVDSRGVKSSSDSVTVSASLRVSTEGLPVLEALLIVVRSLHNCRVLGYYGVVQKLIALIKGIICCPNLMELYMHV